MNFIYQFVLVFFVIIVYRLSVLPAAAAADSPDTERRSGRPHHFRICLFQADFVGAFDNYLRI